MRWPRSLTRTWDAGRASQRTAWTAIAIAVAIAAALVAFAFPLREAIARARDDVARNRLVLDIARARVAANATLIRAVAPARSPDLRAATDREMTKRGLSYAVVDAPTGEGSLRIVIAAAPFDTLIRALDTLAHTDGVRVSDASVSARVDPGTVRAELALTR
ncbi:MAG TPA: type II secretion system protein GspM [Casimicrobiaceae bacterium]|jgi:type II secretory pathway component PulM